MSLAAYLKKYGKEVLHGAESLGPATGTRNRYMQHPGAPHGVGGLLGEGGLIPESAQWKAKDMANAAGRHFQEHPGHAAAAGALGGLNVGALLAHKSEDEDSPGHHVDDLLRKIGLGR